MSSPFQQFNSLHHLPGLFVIPNAWNTKSALLFQEKKFPAIATSSAAVAASLGYEDGEGMPFADYLFVIQRILAAVQLPLSVDMETGYGQSNEAIYANVMKLVELGVAGINIEDSRIDASGRVLKEAVVFAGTIEYIKNKLASQHARLFINVRCDTYILGVENKQQKTNYRLNTYENCGADGIFLPCISDPADIAAAVQQTKLPVNVMCVPGLPDFEVLDQLGVKRVSMGPFLFSKIYDSVSRLSEAITVNKSFAAVFS